MLFRSSVILAILLEIMILCSGVGAGLISGAINQMRIGIRIGATGDDMLQPGDRHCFVVSRGAFAAAVHANWRGVGLPPPFCLTGWLNYDSRVPTCFFAKSAVMVMNSGLFPGTAAIYHCC